MLCCAAACCAALRHAVLRCEEAVDLAGAERQPCKAKDIPGGLVVIVCSAHAQPGCGSKPRLTSSGSYGTSRTRSDFEKEKPVVRSHKAQ